MNRHEKRLLPDVESISLHHENPPGRDSIEYRLGSYHRLLEHLLLAFAKLPGQAGGPPRDRLNTAQHEDFAVALLEAWAAVGEVLCFYQERIANEGYLRTARERLSIKELARQIGYQLAPGLAAQTHVAFTMRNVAGPLTIPTGMGLQSSPAPGKLPLTFETVEAIEARPEWGAMPGYVPTVRRRFRPVPGAQEVILAGIRTALHPGDPLLFLAGKDERPCVRVVASVTPWPTLGATRVQWDTPLPLDIDFSQELSVHRFAKRAGLFGRTAPAWLTLPDETKALYGTPRGGVFTLADGGAAWGHAASGLPPADVRALAIDPSANVLAGTAKGVLRLKPGGVAWETASDLPAAQDVYSLVATADGVLWAGCGSGRVYRSADAGQSWELPRPIPPRRWWPILLSTQASTGKLPSSVVRALAAWARPSKPSPLTLLAGTDHGVFRCGVTDTYWTSWNRGLPGYDSKTGLASAAVQAIAVDEKQHVFVGAKTGFYRWRFWSGWTDYTPLRPRFCCRLWQWVVNFFRRLLGKKPPAPPAAMPITAIAQATGSTSGSSLLFVATGTRLFQSEDRGDRWLEIELPDTIRGASIQALTAIGDPDGKDFRLFLGTDRGAWKIAMDGELAWVEEPSLASPPVQAVAAKENQPWAGTVFQGFVETEWPGFALKRDAIDLDRVYAGLGTGQWVVLGCDEPVLWGAYRVRQVANVWREDFKLAGTITRLTVAASDDLPRYPLRDTTAYLGSVELGLFEWDEPLATPVQGDSLSLAGVVEGLRSQRLLSVSGARMSAALVVPLGGICRVNEAGSALLGLVGQSVLSLAVDKSVIHAAVEGGVQIWQNGLWAPLTAAPSGINALQFDAAGTLCAATGNGVYRLEKGAWSGVGPAACEVFTLALDRAGNLCAGTSDGAFRWDGTAWESIGLDGEKVRALACDAAGKLWAGTSRGVRQELSGAWSSPALPEEDVLSLCFDAQGELHAGTKCGLWHLRGGRWRSTRLAGRINALAMSPQGQLYAGGQGQGLLLFDGTHWNSASLGVANDVTTLTFDADGALLAGSRQRMVLTSLDGLRQEFLQPSVLHSFPAALEQELASGILTPDFSKMLKDAGFVLSPKASLLCAPNRDAWILAEPERTTVLMKQDGVMVLRAGVQVTMMAPASPASSPALEQWTVHLDAKFVGTVEARPGQLIAFGSADETASEIARIESCEVSADRTHTTVILAKPLAAVYAAAEVSACANVAAATHGETVRYELLGSGHGHISNQQFTLHKSPLTFLQTDTETGREPVLTVRVGSRGVRVHPGYDMLNARESCGTEWQQVETLVGSSPSDRVYTVRTDENAATTLTFGDGINGARLPVGPDNVAATYRIGLGTEGNLPAGSIAQLKSRLPGLSKVVNPVPATGGVDAETNDTVRQRAPLSVTSFGGLVSLTDYERCARTFPGVGQVLARRLRAGSRDMLAFAIAAADGAMVPPGDPLLEALGQRLRTLAARPFPILLDTFRPVLFFVHAHVIVADGFSPHDVRKKVIEALHTAYGLGGFPMARSLARSEVIVLIQALPGVMAVEVPTFYREGSGRRQAEVLPANSLAWDSEKRRLRQPECLQLDTKTHAKITTDPAA